MAVRPSRRLQSLESMHVLRFRSQLSEPASAASLARSAAPRGRWRVWILLAALGLVIATMRQLNKPSTAQRLGQWFGTAADVTPQESSHQFVIRTAESSERPPTAAESAAASQPAEQVHASADGVRTNGVRTNRVNTNRVNTNGASTDSANSNSSSTSTTNTTSNALAQVQDNTYFRPAETAAWFGLFDRLQRLDDQQLSAATRGELTYVQLLEQPQVYRGEVVTIRGTLRREEIVHPPENLPGVETYHRLVIQPRGGGQWPFVVYCLELPGALPRGDNLQATIEVTGFFFKNWSYAWQDGLGIAPVVLARSIDWRPPVAQPTQPSLRQWGFAQAVLVAGVFAVLIVSWVVRNTRRRPKRSPPPPEVRFPDAAAMETVAEKLRNLTDAETHE